MGGWNTAAARNTACLGSEKAEDALHGKGVEAAWGIPPAGGSPQRSHVAATNWLGQAGAGGRGPSLLQDLVASVTYLRLGPVWMGDSHHPI